MSRPDLASRMITAKKSATGKISYGADLKRSGRVLATTGGITLTVPTPTKELAMESRELQVVNGATTPITIECATGFTGDRSSIPIPGGAKALLECGLDASTGYQWDVMGPDLPTLARTWTSTVTFTTATPTTTQSGRFAVIDNSVVVFDLLVSCTDGDAGVPTTFTLPTLVQKVDTRIPFVCEQTIDGVKSQLLGYVDATQSTAENRLGTLIAATAWTNAKASSIRVRGWYPMAGFAAYTPTISWTTSPASPTTAFVWRQVGGVAFVCGQSAGTDGNTTSAVTFTMPTGVVDLNTYVDFSCLQLVDTTWSRPYGRLNQLANTDAARLLEFDGYTTHTDAAPYAICVAGIYFVDTPNSFTPTATFTTGTPGTQTKNGFWAMVGNDYVFFSTYLTSADANGCTALVMTPPIPPMLQTGNVLLQSTQLSNATYSCPLAFLDASETLPENRTIQHDGFSTVADGTTITHRTSGLVRIGG